MLLFIAYPVFVFLIAVCPAEGKGFLFGREIGQNQPENRLYAIAGENKAHHGKKTETAAKSQPAPLPSETNDIGSKHRTQHKVRPSASNKKSKTAPSLARAKQKVYYLTIDYKTVNFTGAEKRAMAVNDSIPAPALYFKEGETAVIHVTNKMDVETSLHWHGILLPNFQDGVPYLTTPPVKPGKTHTFTFPLKHSGTYWYHSHTGLQEQQGIYGPIVVEPKKRNINYDHNLTLVLSDWTDEDPKEVLRTLKRGSEWYSVQKNTTQSLYTVITSGALSAQLRMWKQRMPGMDISDVYYPAFLMNGKTLQHYPQFKAGETIRLRVINAGASTYFRLSFGETPILVSADGMDVLPVPWGGIQRVRRMVKMLKDQEDVHRIPAFGLHAIGETYDFLLTVPEGRSVEFRATAQDGSGFASAWIGTGEPLKAPVPPKPDLMKQMKSMARHHGSGGHHGVTAHPSATLKTRHTNEVSHAKPPAHSHHHPQPAASEHRQAKKEKTISHPDDRNRHSPENPELSHARHGDSAEYSDNQAHSAEANPVFGYDDLTAVNRTKFSSDLPVRTIHLNLTGNMRRYVWSFNGKTLSESDKIKIYRNEVIRLVLHNQTMMHHPMHLHGHFFRVLNKQKDYSPLKHTVDVPPMETVTLEFKPDEKGDWFFHCHVLYHMKGGMSRVFSQGEGRDSRLKDYPVSRVWNADRQWYFWGDFSLMTNRTDVNAEASNTRNRVYFNAVVSWFDRGYAPSKNYEASAGYERFLPDIFRIYGSVEAENANEGDLGRIHDADIAGKAGFRYLLPYLIELDIGLDHKMRLEIELEYELLLFSRLELFAEGEWTEYLNANDRKIQKRKREWSLGLDYIAGKRTSLRGSYDSHFGWGVGIHWEYLNGKTSNQTV